MATLCDTSPLVALINRKDPAHGSCKQALSSLDAPLVTTWSCFTEAMYLLGRYGGWPAQQILWGYVDEELLSIQANTSEELSRMHFLMRQYRDKPMDLADASLVAIAETLNQRLIFSLDSDFQTYRFKGKQAFEIVPQGKL
ncbi:MAG: PIN domain-containing protein [Cyanobacteria bacterium P01_E01_bin.34]